MNRRMKIEFPDSCVSSPQRPVSEDSSISNTNMIAPRRSGLNSKQPVVAVPTGSPARLPSHRTHMPVSSVLPLISDAPILANGYVEKSVPEDTQKVTPATPPPFPLATAATAPAKAPCNCGCNKKSKKRKARKSLVVEAGQTKRFDSCANFDRIENKGKIELAEGASLTAVELVNCGSITSQFDLVLNTENLNAVDGFIESPSKITLNSENDLMEDLGESC